jgi:DNA-directed RNA polymerase subunit RPC12/RpoP
MSTGEQPGQVSSICGECGAPVTFATGTAQVTCSHCDAGLAVEQGTRLVRLGCPGCGGNFYYIDGTLSGQCPYCETSLLVVTQNRVLRYVVLPKKERPADAGQAELRLLPFWHLGGLLYAWNVGSRIEVIDDSSTASMEGGYADADGGRQTIRRDSGPMKVFAGRVLNISLPDPSTLALGITSLRLRGSIFPLEPFQQDHESLGRVEPAMMDHLSAREQLFARTLGSSAPTEGMTRMDVRRADLVAECLSLYYYPFWIRRQPDGMVEAWDGVCGIPETLSPPSESPRKPSSSAIFDQLRIIELTCQHCGHALPAGNHSVVLPCRCCNRFWLVSGQGLQPYKARYARPRLPAENPVWLPFWQVPVELSYGGRQATTVADLTGVLGVLRPPVEHPKAAPGDRLTYFVPAYGAMKMPRVDHAARDMTRHQPALEPVSPPEEGELFHCFYSPDDARRLAYVTWMLILPGVVIPRLRSLRISIPNDAAALWYVPFDDRGREIVNLLTGLRYDWSAFRGVRH